MDKSLTRFTLALALVLSSVPMANAIEICTGGNRAARKVTCLVDRDTGWQDGVKWRLLEIDTPETFEAECPAEKQRARSLRASAHEIKKSK